MDERIRAAALEYHALPRPGKIAVVPTKALTNQRDLSLAYSPGVAAACDAIVDDPATASLYTARANLIGVVTNGTAVLGLGAIGPLAAKPVMEGKGVLFKKFAGIDVFDIEIAERDPDKLVDIIASLEPTFGGINLEDIKAPECFYIERKLRERMKIPVFHDDQHGTAIVVGAAILNGLHLLGKPLDQIKLVTSGAGAAALACLDLLVMLGIPVRNIWVTDIKGVVYEGRTEEMDPIKSVYAKSTGMRTLTEVIEGADVFLGLSAAGVLKPAMVMKMAANPLILALANPVPEIMPDEVKAVRPDAIVATGRSDHPNQVNNVLCFPFIFRGALDVGATTISDEMQLAAVRAIAELARAEQSDVVVAAYGEQVAGFGREYIIPRPFDPRLIVRIAPAVAKAAMDSGVATRPIEDWDAYRQQLNNFVWHSGLVMKPVFSAAKREPRRIIFAEGESERVLRAVQTVVDEGIAQPILIGRPDVISMYIERFGLRIRPGVDFELVNQDSDPRYRELWSHYHQLMERRGVSVEYAKREVRRRSTLIGALMLKFGWADGMICGTYGLHNHHLRFIESVVGRRSGVKHFYAMNLLALPGRTIALCDTYVNYDPSAEQVFEMTCLAAEELQRFGITPRVALLSHSSFGTDDTPTARKMREALTLLHERRPDIEAEGEMHGDAALDACIRQQIFPNARMRDDANLLVFPTLDAANIAFNLIKTTSGDGMTVGPILLGAARPVHILTPTATVRRIVNMTALTVVDAAQIERRG
ncbi:NADP-dependent malic enzyme [Uliginosibacterium sp. 31-12]|uniref:NADP-dependent malic enzyme n=1 Tax=Uliginosibacterium sp. 31-12 TaxID=3062781 RepID=UPI0026E34000|nr:NADP-dependent malic enzyme [Uliginosibacterium sp. 31-12]MDO6384730.1 NADP-dependent malic enzyme [Uliginosibacterium sp. 31-12]